MTSPEDIRFTILHTNDLHSCFEGLGPDAYLSLAPDSRDPVKGHYARLAALIRNIRAEREAHGETVFLVDAGDAEFGSLFHLLGPRSDHPEMPEYRFFHDLGYDFLGLGNHFFESGPDGLRNAWRKVEAQGLRLPFLVSNAVFTDPEGFVAKRFLASPQPAGTTGFHRLAVREISHGGKTLRIGWMGLLGPYGAKVSLANRPDLSFTGFDDATGKERHDELHAHARTLARELRETHHADLVVAIFHGGHREDQALARAVPDIDVVIAGHTHAVYAETVGRTVLAQAGFGSGFLGCLDFSWSEGKPVWMNPSEASLPVTSALAADPAVSAQIDQYKRDVNGLLASGPPPRVSPGPPAAETLPCALAGAADRQGGAPFAYETPVFTLDRDLPRRRYPDNAAGTFVTSGLRAEINRRVTPPVEVFFSSYGLVRSEFLCVDGRPTTFQYSDVFKFFPLGFGKDFRVGTPIHTFYLTRADLKSLLEAMAAVSMVSPVFEPVISDSLTFRIVWWGIPFFNKVRDLQLHGVDFVPDESLVHVATDEYFSRNLRRIKTLSLGFSQAIPRDVAGQELPAFPESPLPPEHDLLACFLQRLDRGKQGSPPHPRRPA